MNPSCLTTARVQWDEVHTCPGRTLASQLTWFWEIRSSSSFYHGQTAAAQDFWKWQLKLIYFKRSLMQALWTCSISEIKHPLQTVFRIRNKMEAFYFLKYFVLFHSHLLQTSSYWLCAGTPKSPTNHPSWPGKSYTTLQTALIFLCKRYNPTPCCAQHPFPELHT